MNYLRERNLSGTKNTLVESFCQMITLQSAIRYFLIFGSHKSFKPNTKFDTIQSLQFTISAFSSKLCYKIDSFIHELHAKKKKSE